jgi:hypothetical protein
VFEQLEGAKARRDTSLNREVCELVLQRLCEFSSSHIPVGYPEEIKQASRVFQETTKIQS